MLRPEAGQAQLVEARPGRLQDLLGRGRADIDVDVAGEPLPEVVVQLRLEVGDDLVGPAEDEALERPTLEEAHQRLGGVPEVVVLLLLDAALVAGL